MEADKTLGKRGPQLGRSDVKGEILAAAQMEFAEHGFRGATIRRIARRAHVDPKLIHYYFGTKSDLFMQCIPSADGVADVLHALRRLLVTPEFTGEHYVAMVLSTWESSSFGPAFLSLVKGIGEHEESRTVVRRFLIGEVSALLRADGEIPNLEQRTALIGTQMYGLVMLRYVLKHPTICALERAELAKLVGPVIDHYRSL